MTNRVWDWIESTWPHTITAGLLIIVVVTVEYCLIGGCDGQPCHGWGCFKL